MAEAQECVSFLDYDRVSDDLMYFDRDVYLRFNVQLARKGKDGNRYHYHNEYRYQSKYDNYGKVLSTDRSWTITTEKMALTNNAYFMHCLPVRRNMIVSDEVIESERSLVIPEAANREISAQVVLKRILESL